MSLVPRRDAIELEKGKRFKEAGHEGKWKYRQIPGQQREESIRGLLGAPAEQVHGLEENLKRSLKDLI